MAASKISIKGGLAMLATLAVAAIAQFGLAKSSASYPRPNFNPAALSSPIDGPNLLKNPSFEIVGPNGPATTITTNAPGGAGNSAAESWGLFTNTPGTIKTELLPSTKQGGGSRMIHVTTDGDRNGLDQVFGKLDEGPLKTTGSVWVFIKKGKVGIGMGNVGNTGIDKTSTTNGKWELLEAYNGASPVNTFIIYSVGGGADFDVDSASVESLGVKPAPKSDSGSANCAQIAKDIQSVEKSLASWKKQLAKTPGPDGPGTERDKIKQTIATLNKELATLQAASVNAGCVKVPKAKVP